MTDVAISRQVPLGRLTLPEDDVRQGRDPGGVRSIAASMGDPDVGQQQPITVYPAEYEDLPEGMTEEELTAMYEDGSDLVVHDGVTRLRAAQELGWRTLWAVLVDSPPENEVVARLEANTERLDMSDYEVYTALYDHYEDSDATLKDVGEKVGVSESYISQVFGLFDEPEWLLTPWEDDTHSLETSHALAVRAMLTENSIESYQQAGDLDRGEAEHLAEQDARLMIDVQAEHGLGVSDFRDRCTRCAKETLDQLRDQRSREEKQADGETRAAEREASSHTPTETPDHTCLMCGAPADRKIAVDVCREDYGLLSELKAAGETLPEDSGAMASSPSDSEGPATQPQDAVQALAAVTDISPKAAREVIHEVQQQAAQSPQEAENG